MCNSAAEYYLHTVGAAGSNPATPTILIGCGRLRPSVGSTASSGAARVSPGGEQFYRTEDALRWLTACELHGDQAPDVEGFEIVSEDPRLWVRMDLISDWGDAARTQAMQSARDLLTRATASEGRELVWSLLF